MSDAPAKPSPHHVGAQSGPGGQFAAGPGALAPGRAATAAGELQNDVVDATDVDSRAPLPPLAPARAPPAPQTLAKSVAATPCSSMER